MTTVQVQPSYFTSSKSSIDQIELIKFDQIHHQNHHDGDDYNDDGEKDDDVDSETG